MKSAAGPPKEREFTPPLGKSWLTPFYDRAIAVFTRERRWRRAIVEKAALLPGDKVIVALSPYDLTRGRIVYRHR